MAATVFAGALREQSYLPASHAIPSQHHPSVGVVEGVTPVFQPGSRRCLSSGHSTDEGCVGPTNLGRRTPARNLPIPTS